MLFRSDLKMKGVEVSDGWLQVAKTDRHDAIKSQAELLTEKLGATIELWPADRVRQSLRSRLYFGAIHHPRAFSIHPLNYALGLAAAAEAAGARIFEQTPALEVDPEGVRKRVVTKHGRVRASHVVLAGNVHLAELAPRLARTLVPVHTYVVTSADRKSTRLNSSH